MTDTSWALVEGKAVGLVGPLLLDARIIYSEESAAFIQVKAPYVQHPKSKVEVIFYALVPCSFTVKQVIKSMSAVTGLAAGYCILTRSDPPAHPETGFSLGFEHL